MDSRLIVEKVFHVYHCQLLQNGKPQNLDEFTVLAAVVAKLTTVHQGESSITSNYKVLSLATGTKCVGEEVIDEAGHILHDSHAEVIARRGLIRYLLETLIALSQQPSFEDDIQCPISRNLTPQSTIPYQIKPGWSFYLYVSDNPCGDASIYPTVSGEMAFTGAKLTTTAPFHASSLESASIEILRKENGLIIEKDEQVLGQIRTKSSRSDTQHPTNSMSCSDKICRWNYLGLQGSILYSLVGRVELSGIVVGRDPCTTIEAQTASLNRAIVTRCSTLPHYNDAFQIMVVDEEPAQFLSSKGIVKYRFTNEVNEENALCQPALSLTPAENNDSLLTVSNAAKRTLPFNIEGIGSKGDSNKRQRKIQPIPCGTSINWISSNPINHEILSDYCQIIKHNIKFNKTGTQEVTIAHTGLPHGTTQKTRGARKVAHDFNDVELPSTHHPVELDLKPKKLAISRLSRFALKQLFRICLQHFLSLEQPSSDDSPDFKEWKESLPIHNLYQQLLNEFFQHSLFQSWKRKQ